MPTNPLSTGAAAQLLGISQRTIERKIKNGQLEANALDPGAKRLTYIISRTAFDTFRRTYKKRPHP